MATRPERRPRDQDRRRAARCRPVFPFGIGTKAVNLCILIKRTDYLISKPRFLHFTLNHYTLTNLPVDNEPAAAVEQAAKVEERPGDVDVRDVDVPVFVGPQGLNKAFPFE